MKKNKFKIIQCIISAALAFIMCFTCTGTFYAQENKETEESEKSYIKWVDFKVSADAMRDCAKVDIDTNGGECHESMIELLTCLAVKYGGNFSLYKKSDLDAVTERHAAGEEYSEIASNEKLYNYYREAYGAALGGAVGKYLEYTENENGETVCEEKYGVCLSSPIAAGYYYNHYDDFGASRSYGYKRHHLGHDLMGSVGTPITAVEAGYVEACGWNRYGGWRIGIRSFDGKRYYYYAHLRKDKPYEDIYEGKTVAAGEVIGYLGMTGYSEKENVNGINTPHLHYGLELIFDPSQKDGYCQIWLDMYALTAFLSGYTSGVYRTDNGMESKKIKIPEYMWD